MEAVPAIGDLAEQGTEVVRELLYFARRESAAPRTIDLVELVRQQEAVLRHLLPDGLELGVELEEEAVPVVADPVGLRRLLVNLVINARDAVEESGGRITVRVEHTAGRAVLEVADDGEGIPPEAREHLFEPFFTLRRQGRGSGLGLAVVYSIVSAHNGEVDVLSVPGEGARFIVRLPLAEAGGLEPLEGHTSSAASATRVLLVEKDGRAAARKVEALAEAGLEVRHAPSFSNIADLTQGWLPTVMLVAEDALSTKGGELDRLQLPVSAARRCGRRRPQAPGSSSCSPARDGEPRCNPRSPPRPWRMTRPPESEIPDPRYRIPDPVKSEINSSQFQRVGGRIWYPESGIR